MSTWPPDLAFLKVDQAANLPANSPVRDEQLGQVLAAAVSYVERVRGSDYNFTEDPLSDKPDPPADLMLGTVRLAFRWHMRRRSPDALLSLGDMGGARVPSFDPDIEKMLGVGRYAPARFA